MKPLLSTIIVNYNTKELLQKCLESVIKSQESGVRSRESAITEIIVVDNGSTDGSVEMVKKLITFQASSASNIKLIQNESNLGFAKAVNQGIKTAQGEKILLLNSDIIVKKGAIKKLLAFMNNQPQVGVVGGRLLDVDDSPQGSCFYLPTLARAIKEFWLSDKKISIVKKYIPSDHKPSEVESVSGAVFLISRETIKKVGLLDERYFMYFEDLDYCRRVRKAGLKVFYVPQAEFIHYHGLSGKKIPEKTQKWLVESSKIYHGLWKYWLLTFIIKTGRKWQTILGKS